MDIQAVFDKINEIKSWGEKSGPGSKIENVQCYVDYLKWFIKSHNIKTILDCGCGYVELIQHLDLTTVEYTGIDIVSSVVDENKLKYPSLKFIHGDISQLDIVAKEHGFQIPYADLLICKDVLQHLPNSIIQSFTKFLHMFRYSLVTNDIGENKDRDYYVLNSKFHFHGLDLAQHPFNVNGTIVNMVNNKKTLLISGPLTPGKQLAYVPKILIAILAKDSEGFLKLYLKCIESLDYPKDKICIYVRTNNNKDDTANILKKWCDSVRASYSDIVFNDFNVEEPVEKFGRHEWNKTRFKVLGAIRETSMKHTLSLNCDYYFVADVDNFIMPHTLKDLVSLQLPIVAPLIRKIEKNNNLDVYANLHHSVTENGYYSSHPDYQRVITREISGIICTELVHCTYLVRADVIPNLTYDDMSYRHEYVIFSHSARKNGIQQYIDTRKFYGVLTMEDNTNSIPYLIDMSKDIDWQNIARSACEQNKLC